MPSPSSPRLLPGSLPLLRVSLGVTQMALWLGPHSLIQSQIFFHRESYQQISYAHIQALTLRRTPRGLMYGILLALIVGAFGWIAYAVDSEIARFTSTFFAVLWLLLFSVNALRGRTCRVQLQTALGIRDLPTLNRVRPARRALRAIVEQVESVQGSLNPQEASAQMEELLSSAPRAMI